MPRPHDPHPEGTPHGRGPAREAQWVLSVESCRRLDRLAVERYGIPSIVLMENASIGLRDAALGMMARAEASRVVIVAGTGNNGGDGLALARHLHNGGAEVGVVLVGEASRVGGDAATNLDIVRRMNIPFRTAGGGAGLEAHLGAARTLVVDALLGTGLRDAPREPAASAIGAINRARSPRTPVLAVDVPSGLDADTGEPAGGGPAVEADLTVTFAALKPGFLRLGAQRWTGEVRVAGIGAPRELLGELGELVEDARPHASAEPDEPASPEGPPSSHGRRAGRGG
jgi:NAD(P)H-hydrate epimerase